MTRPALWTTDATTTASPEVEESPVKVCFMLTFNAWLKVFVSIMKLSLQKACKNSRKFQVPLPTNIVEAGMVALRSIFSLDLKPARKLSRAFLT